jgi:hypothetical protein
MALRVLKLKKPLLLLCILLFLIDLGHDGRLGPAKSRIGWGHGFRLQTEAYSHAIRPLPSKTKIPFMQLYVNTAVPMLHIGIQITCNVANLVKKYYLPGHGSGGVPL